MSVQIPSAPGCFSCHLGCYGHQKGHKPPFSITISPEAFSSVVPHRVWIIWSNFTKIHQQNSSPLCFEDQKTVTWWSLYDHSHFFLLSHSPFSPYTSKWWQIQVLITPAAAFTIFISYLSVLRPSNIGLHHFYLLTNDSLADMLLR